MKFLTSAVATIALLSLISPAIARSEVKKSPTKTPRNDKYGGKKSETKKLKPKKSCDATTGTPTPTPTLYAGVEPTEESRPVAKDENLYNSALVLEFAALPVLAILFAI